ncbi:MlaD family protein [Actinomadura algeriensis]|uniref:Phospholipid/cholesterol/gamma-HCH transport system substrate-binding protein n=1 Tax=Actinomadura algeriensis TaxID=1679523 RepID=A0ABR9JMJ8_9ACTN|nr:MlaD family protein [Actinomadura algeriensis]MBE1531786.1 phospholipid/cholesterol/gamma-HCH transport system substrate-binding protein [Actinomadura algeriensis]
MLTLGTRIKNLVFLVVGLYAVAHVGLNYADLGKYIGLADHYVIEAELGEAGGLAENADVTYRGSSVGRVGELQLTADGVVAELRIDDDAPPLPESTKAVVANRSAIGEQYIDLRPATDSGPYMEAGAVIPRAATSTPPPVTDLLTSLNSLAQSVPTDALRTVVDELGVALAGQGPNLRALLDETRALTDAANANLTPTRTLIDDAETVLRTQNQEAASLKSFGENARLLADQLRESDPAFRDLVDTAPDAATELRDLVRDLDPSMSVLLANLLTTSELLANRTDGLEQLMSELPAAVAAGTSVVHDGRLNFGMVTTFFDPPNCTAGYEGTKYRNGLDTSPGAPLNTAAACTRPPSSGVNVRGSANVPRRPVPEPARAGSVLNAEPDPALPGALALPGLPNRSGPPNGTPDLRALLALPEARP